MSISEIIKNNNVDNVIIHEIPFLPNNFNPDEFEFVSIDGVKFFRNRKTGTLYQYSKEDLYKFENRFKSKKKSLKAKKSS